MTAAEQASLDLLRKEMNDGFRELRGIMEQRRGEEDTKQAALEARIRNVEQSRSVIDAFFDFGKYLVTVAVAVGAVAATVWVGYTH